MPDYTHDGIEVRFTDQGRGLSISKLLSNMGTFDAEVISQHAEGEFFAVLSPEYQMSLTVRQGVVEFRRNSHVARKEIGPYRRSFKIVLSWMPHQFQLVVGMDNRASVDAVVTIRTAPIFVPLTLLQWSRQYSLLKRLTYRSKEEFLGILFDAPQQAKQKIRSTNGHSLFWDRQRSGSTSPRLVPKREPEAMAGLTAFLQDQSTLSGFELIRESATGPGSLDLFVIAPLSAGGSVRVCVEGKNAHSRDIEHGVTDQLPAYMKRKQADHGIYLVLWYQCEAFPEPREDEIDLTLRLRRGKPFRNITVECFDLSLPRSPSDPDFEFS
jgi:hypothetical protein